MTLLFNSRKGRRDSGVNFDDIILPLIQQDQLKHQHHLESDDAHEVGIYSKHPRIIVVKDKKDAFKKINIYQLRDYMKARVKNEDHSPIWIDVQGMDQDSLQIVSEIFNLHPFTTEECATTDTLEKIVKRNNYIYMVFNDFSMPPDESGEVSVNLNILVFRDLILTIHAKPVNSIYTVPSKIEHCVGARVPSVEYLLYIILARMLDYCEKYLSKLATDTEALDHLVVTIPRVHDGSDDTALLARITAITKLTSSMREGVGRKVEIFSVLLRHKIFSNNGLRYMKNANDHLLKMEMKLDLSRDLLADISSLYMSKLQVEVSFQANDMGVVTRRFGIFSTIFLPLNLLAGIYGMNTLVPNNVDDKHPLDTPKPFIIIMFFMVIISTLQILLFYYLKWL